MNRFKFSVSLLIAVFPFILTLVGEAATYEWVDDGGAVHFTDDRDRVPAKFMNRVKERDSVKGEAVKSPVVKVPEKATPSLASPAEKSAPVFGGYDERYWRASFASIRDQIKSQEERMAVKRADLNQLRRKRIMHKRTSDRVAYNDLDKEISRDEAYLKELKEKLKALDTEAQNAGAPAEWRQ